MSDAYTINVWSVYGADTRTAECFWSPLLVAIDPSTDFRVADSVGGEGNWTASNAYSLPAQFLTTTSQLHQSCWTATVRGNGSNLHPALRLAAGWHSVSRGNRCQQEKILHFQTSFSVPRLLDWPLGRAFFLYSAEPMSTHFRCIMTVFRGSNWGSH